MSTLDSIFFSFNTKGANAYFSLLLMCMDDRINECRADIMDVAVKGVLVTHGEGEKDMLCVSVTTR